jgi:hypothetical protein
MSSTLVIDATGSALSAVGVLASAAFCRVTGL